MTTSASSSWISAETTLANRTVRKLKIRLLPWLFLLFVVAYIDRINIGFAALTMNRELGISSRQFGVAAGIFFFGYLIFEVPSNLLLHKIGARIWMARILLTWGILAMATGFVRNLHQLYAVRFLLGAAEAGYFPGIVLISPTGSVAANGRRPWRGLLLPYRSPVLSALLYRAQFSTTLIGWV